QVHVGVVLDMAAERAVEVPEPVRAEAVAPGAPERLVSLLDETRAGLQDFGRPAHMEREVLAALHERRRLDHEQRVMIERAGRLQKRSDALEAIRTAKAEALDIERLRFRGIGHEVDDVRK